MTFGFTNMQACFQRIMQWVLGELVGKMCLVYINNVVVWGQNPEEVL